MRVKSLAIAAAALFFVSIQVRAAIDAWSAIGPTGGTIDKIAVSPTPSTVFAIASGGFYRSQDGAATWQLISSDFFNAPSDMALDPADPTRVYVSSVNAPVLLVSTDGGATLAPAPGLPTALTQVSHVVVGAGGMTLYLTSAGQIYGSSDRGHTWTQRTAMTSYGAALVAKIVGDPTDANTLYAAVYTSGTTEAIVATHDGGVSWQQLVVRDPSSSAVFDLAVNPANPLQLWAAQNDGIWVSNDRGSTWTSMFSTGGTAIAVDPTNPSVMYAGTGSSQVYRTADSGASWTDVSGNMTAGQVVDIAVNPSQNSQIFVGGINGLAVSSTSGSTWSTQDSGIDSTTIVGLSADPSTDRIYVNVSSGGVYYEAGGSGSTAPVDNAALLQLSAPTTVLNVTSILAEQGRLFASLPSGLAASADGGNTWSLDQVTPSPPNQLFALASPANTPQTVLAASSDALYRTTDGGVLWPQITAGMPAGSTVTQLLTAPSDPTVAYASVYAPPPSGIGAPTNLGVYASADAGATWTAANGAPASGPTLLFAVDPSAAHVIYGATSSALLKSIDGGNTWNAMTWDQTASGGTPFRFAVDPAHPQILYAATVGRIARSVDGGASWETLRVDTALPPWSPSSLTVDPNRPANLLVGTLTSGVQQITIAPDLAIAAAAPASPIAVGLAATYAYTVSNLGPFDATDATITVQLPPTAQTVSVSSPTTACTVVAAVATCNFAVLRAGSQATLAVTATPPAAGSFPVVASVAGDQPDPAAQNDSVTSTATVAVVADLSVTAAGTSAAQIGDAVSYTVTVKDSGPNAAPATQLSFQLAAGITPGTVSSTGASCAIGTSGSIGCDLGTVAAGASVTVSIAATAAKAGTQISTATVSSSATDPTTSNDTATAHLTVSAPPPPPPPPAGGKGGGGGLSGWDLVVLALLAAVDRRFRGSTDARKRG